jgi:hypothetical protein
MKSMQLSNGPEGAKNPSKNKTGIQTPNNGSHQQSLYIAAIAQFIGCEGLASPATDMRDGIQYTFDFHHPECLKVFKVFKSSDLSEYDKYVQYPGDVIAIVDVDDNPGCQLGKCPCCDDAYVIVPRDLGEKLHDADATYVYFRHHLCEYIGDEKDGTSQWVILDPIVLRDSEEDDEFDSEEDDD